MSQICGVVTIGGSPAAGVTIRFYKSGVSMGDAITGPDGSYGKYLAAAKYTAAKIAPAPTVPLFPNPLNVISSPQITNLSDTGKKPKPKPRPKKAAPKKAAPKKAPAKKK